MNRGRLTEEVKKVLIAEGFEGTVIELRLMPYLLMCLSDNRLPDYRRVSYDENVLMQDWLKKRMIVSCNAKEGFIVTEKLYDRMVKIVKLGYCSDVIEPTTVDKTIIFEGVDSSGKSSIMTKLWNDLDMHKHHIFDRSFISDYAYGIKFNRHTYKGVPLNTYYEYWSNYYANNKNLKVILCTADSSILFRRCIDKNDPLIKDKSTDDIVEELIADDNLFKNYVHAFCKKYNVPMLIIDTTEETLEQSYKKAKDFIEED